MAESTILRAGPVEATFVDGDLRHIRYGTAEVVQRIYAAMRDRNWGTPPGRLENVVIAQEMSEFRIVFDSVHRQRDVDFRWHGTITGTAAGAISFTMDGRAYATFLRNRIGLCVHHPLRECAGKPCTIEIADGTLERTQFPEFVAPHQPFLNLRAITYEPAPGVRAEVRFHGEIFETEDHRNWTDANFKTYGTPLVLPFPVEVAAGTQIHQRIEIVISGLTKLQAPTREYVVRVRTGSPSGLKIPRIGLGTASDGRQLTEGERNALRRLRLNHLRVDLPLRADERSVIEAAAADASAIGAKLEVAVTLPCDPGRLSEWAPQVDRWLVYSAGEKATGEAAARKLRPAVGPEAFIAAGTNAYLAELNRNRPKGDGWNAGCFSINPQVHAFDDESVMANASAQFDAVRSARQFLGGRPVVVSPVTLRPRFNPDATAESERPAPDPRQKLPFCAAWTVASFKALAEAGAASVTYYETRGAGGVLDGDEIYPVFDVLETIGEFGGAELIPCESSDVSRIAPVAFALGHSRRLMIANLTGQNCAVLVDGGPEMVKLEPYAVARIDGQTE